jgi:D-sedoheptulose 7-phosphate isomerase
MSMQKYSSVASHDFANDYSYEMVFARQIEALGCAGDVALGIRTREFRQRSTRDGGRALEADGYCGPYREDGGHLVPLVDYCIRIPSERTPRIQEAHILTGHILCEILEHDLFGR